MHTTRFFPLLGTLVLVTPGISSASETIVGPPITKAGFQAVLDAASDGDEIVCLGGVYDFSDLGAVLITKGLEIKADDPNNPPIFVGKLDSMDAFFSVPGPTNLTGNTAFAVPPGAVVDGLELEGLRFEGFERAFTTVVGFDLSTCQLLTQPGSLKDLELEGNHFVNCGSGMQILGGPLEDFEIKNNFIDCRNGNNVALNVQGDYGFCLPTFVNTLRLVKGEIKGNEVYGAAGPPAINVAGVVKIEVKNNTVYGHPASPGILVRDMKAVTTSGPWGSFAGAQPPFGDDGPIELGEIKNNVIYNAQFGIRCQAATTLEQVEITGNTLVNSVVFDIFLSNSAPGFNGSNGFTVTDNTFSGTAAVADVFLAPATFNNVIEVPTGTNVVDLGNNTVTFD